MFNALTKSFSRPSASQRRSATIDALLAADLPILRNTVRVLVLGSAGSGKSTLLRLLARNAVSTSGDGQHDAGDSAVSIGGGDEEDSRSSTVSSVTLAPSGDYSKAAGQAKRDDDFPAVSAVGSINEVLLKERDGFHFHFAEMPSTLSWKIMHQFEHGTAAVVYLVDLSSYADTDTPPEASPVSPPESHSAPFPDPDPASAPAPAQAQTCRLQASLDVLESLLQSQLLRKGTSLVIVMLTKADRLAAKLQLTPFRDAFPAFSGEETVSDVSEYVLALLEQINVRNNNLVTRIDCAYPAVLNLAEEDEAKAATIRAGVMSFLTDKILRANLRMMCCFGSSSIPDEKQEVNHAV